MRDTDQEQKGCEQEIVAHLAAVWMHGRWWLYCEVRESRVRGGISDLNTKSADFEKLIQGGALYS